MILYAMATFALKHERIKTSDQNTHKYIPRIRLIYLGIFLHASLPDPFDINLYYIYKDNILSRR